jgi:hypothetical protein
MKIKANAWYLATNKFSITAVVSREVREISKKDGAFLVTYVSNVVVIEIDEASYTAELDIPIKPALCYADIEPHLIFKCVTGSRAYGTNIPTSDTDYKGIYVLPESFVHAIEYDEDWDEIKVRDKENNSEGTYYEIRKFLRLLAENNPNTLEVFNLPDDCIIKRTPEFDLVLRREKEFITKQCHDSFLRYATAQIKKAKGQNKMQNWEKARTQRRGVLDFCFTFKDQGSQPIKEWLAERCLKQEDCGLTAIDHMRFMYGVYVSTQGKYRGIVQDEVDSFDVSLSETEIGSKPLCYMQFNKDGYQSSCADYKSYQTHLKERNEQRWVEVKGHDQKVDGKNMLHCVRLIMMARDIADGRGIIVRRPEAEYLKSIRAGEVSLEELIEWSSKNLDELKEKFASSGLPDEVAPELAQQIYDGIRKLKHQ